MSHKKISYKKTAPLPISDHASNRTDVRSEVPYTRDVPITFYNEDPANRAFGRTAGTGHHMFGMNHRFSTEMNEYPGGIHKTEEVR